MILLILQFLFILDLIYLSLDNLPLLIFKIILHSRIEPIKYFDYFMFHFINLNPTFLNIAN